MAEGPDTHPFLRRARDVKRIIVVDLGFLGDSVHLVPALWEIKRRWPQAELHTLSAAAGAELLRLAPCVDRAWAFPLTPQSPPWWRHWRILFDMRRQHYDAAINFSGADRTIFVTALLGARASLAHEAGRKHFWNHWLAGQWIERRSREWPVFEQRRQVLAAAGFELQAPRFDLRVPAEARDWAAGAVANAPVHLSLSASSPMKEWPLENWIDFVRLWCKRNPTIPLIATVGPDAREQQRLRDLRNQVGNASVEGFGGISIAQLAALLERCRLHIGADSGPLHLAYALGVPTLAIFRQYAGLAEWLPVGPTHRHIAVRCPCIEKGQADCGLVGRSACLGGITPAAVLELACQQCL
jgi:ADP-heptose:LPS heptosyltransferase